MRPKAVSCAVAVTLGLLASSLCRSVIAAVHDRALIRSISEGDLSAAEIQLHAGADPNSRDAGYAEPADRRSSPHDLFDDALSALTSVFTERPEESKKICRPPALVEMFLYSSKGAPIENLQFLRELLARGADPNLADEYGVTALDRAAENDFVASTITLLLSGAKADSKDHGGQTPLFYSRSRCISPLIRAGADANARDSSRNTPLIAASYRSDDDAIIQLIEAGADVNAANKWGFCPLAGAVRGARIETVRIMVAHGAKADHTNVYGRTVLMDAVSNKDPHVLELIYRPNQNVDERDQQGRTALANAVLQDRAIAVEFLIKRGADVNVCDKYGRPLMAIARGRNNPAIIRMLGAAGARG
jgi:ankyrin repeat protein